jgi:site-specific recombinase XerD
MHSERGHNLPAWDLLASQPLSANQSQAVQHDRIVISAQIDDAGREHVLSRYGDAVWDIRPFIDQPGVGESSKFIRWPADCPTDMVADCKAVLYAWTRRGRPGMNPPHWITVKGVAVASCVPLMRWLQRLDVSRFDQIKPLHISNYRHHCQHERRLSPWGVFNRLNFFDLLWAFRTEAAFGLTLNPWGTSTLMAICGIAGNESGANYSMTGTAKTPLIPADIQTAIFRHCEAVMAQAPALLDARDQGTMRPTAPPLLALRAAALYLVSITTGMRNDEVLGLENNAWRTQVRNGITYRWVRSTEHKTKKGVVEYLCPALTLDVLAVLQRFAQPLQQQLAGEIQTLQIAPPSPSTLTRLAQAQADHRRLFLGVSQRNHNRIRVLTCAACGDAFDHLATDAGTQWKLNPHQTRRTYARLFVESRMGRASLIFLKDQFKHTSMSMTQLYASNPQQDRALFDEILSEVTAFKGGLLDAWTGSTPLSGGAGHRIVALRATAHHDRKALLNSAAEQIHIRATGHGWCLAQDDGCGGAGLYEATRCVDCKNAVIDDSFADTWLGIHEQQRELLALDDVGQAVQQRARRDAERSASVLSDLGVRVLT